MSDFGHNLKIKYGLAPHEPTEEQLTEITIEIQIFQVVNRRDPNDAELGSIVARICPTYQTYKYGAEVSLALRQALNQLLTKGK